MSFEFATVPRIIFGAGTLSQLHTVLPRFGRRALVVTGHSSERAAPLLHILSAQKMNYAVIPTSGEPTIDEVRIWTQQARETGWDMVIGFGGGSVLDSAKAIAALLTNEGDPLDYLEVIGKGKTIHNLSAPFIAVPTTAGTGSEVTNNAVLASKEHRVKVSLRSPLMLAQLAIVDSQLTHSTPKSVTAQSGLDALTQVIEPFVSNQANPMTDALCREGIQRIGRSLQRAYEHGDDANAREDMALGSLFGGLALSNAKLGAVHGIAGPFGGMFGAPHGAICARLLPIAMRANISALRQRQSASDTLRRYDEIAHLMSGDASVTADDGAVIVQELVEKLNIPSLSVYGVTKSDIPALVEKSMVASSMKGNPVELTPAEVADIIESAC